MKQRSVWIAAALLLLVSACSEDPSGPAGNDPSNGASEELQKGNADGIDIRDRYVVMFKDNVENVDAMTDELMRGNSGKVHYRYHHAIKGFAATIPPQAVEGIRHNPNVAIVEPDGIVSKNGTQNNPPSWGLDRIDQRYLPLDNTYNYPNQGEDVTAYIIDTGIRFDHQEYNGRAFSGWDFVQNDNDASDCDGHGTHVAGTVGGTTVGVAKKVTLIAVRVLNCQGSGTWSGVVAGVDWVTANASGPSVANMSLGGGYFSIINTAVENSIAAGVVYAVSAGNSNANACNYSPASAPNALTVGATTSSDGRSYFSNYGSCVDVFAPGSSIRSSTMNSTSSYANWSGTSMASPHVAGVAALYLSSNPNATPAQVNAAIVNGATSGVVSNPGSGSPNLLLYNMIAGPPPTPTVPADPSGLSVSNIGQNSADISWNDNSSNETGFRIEYKVSSNSTWSSTTVGSNVTNTTLSGLSSSTTYDVRVFAYNGTGDSQNPAGPASFTTTAPPTAPASPTLLSASNVTENSADLNWTDNSNDETGFRIEYSTNSGSSWNSTTVGADVSSTTLSGLSSGTTYDVRVWAYNSAGDSPSATNTVNFSTQTPPPTPDMWVSGITATATPSKGKNWDAEFVITVTSSNGPVAGATVSGDFGGGANGSANAVTNSSGQCVVSTKCNHKAANASFTVTGVTASGYNYNALLNATSSETVNAP
ncbi:S8 family serine peptidase [bacterium]|nr:S8 family serine peptidase [bacterium]